MVVSIVVGDTEKGLGCVGDTDVTAIGTVLMSLIDGESVKGLESVGDDVVSVIGEEVSGDVGSSEDNEGVMDGTIAGSVLLGSELEA